MKKAFVIAMALMLLIPCATAEIEKKELWGEVYYAAEPGTYRIGESLPAGTYSVWCTGEGTSCVIYYSDYANADGSPDLSAHFSYNCAFFSEGWPQGAHPVITVNKYGVLQILGKNCTLYPVKSSY